MLSFSLNKVISTAVILKVKDKTLDKPFRPEFTTGIKNKPLRVSCIVFKRLVMYESIEKTKKD